MTVRWDLLPGVLDALLQPRQMEALLHAARSFFLFSFPPKKLRAASGRAESTSA